MSPFLKRSADVAKLAILVLFASAVGMPVLADNPCAAKNACAAKNPCAAKNACAAKNPCAMGTDPKLVTRPAGTKPYSASKAALLAEGERLWKSTALSSNGLACETCHQEGGAFNASFASPYPHAVGMPQDRAGLKQVSAEQMVQFCMVNPMAAKPLGWDSRDLAALTAYVGEAQKAYVRNPPRASTAGGNPCAMKNPCAGKNPCAAKPH